MRRTLAATLIGLSLVALPAAATAAPPSIDTTSGRFEIDIDFPAGSFCDDALVVHLKSRTRTITFLDRNGDPIRSLTTGRLEAWVTNPSSGITVYQNIPGPSFFDAAGILVRGTGPWSGIQTVDGVTVSVWGNISFDADGLVTAVRGRVVPLCPRLG